MPNGTMDTSTLTHVHSLAILARVETRRAPWFKSKICNIASPATVASVIGLAGVGVDNVDVEAARAAGCWVLNTPGAPTTSLVELTLAHMLAAARGLQDADVGLKSHTCVRAPSVVALPRLARPADVAALEAR